MILSNCTQNSYDGNSVESISINTAIQFQKITNQNLVQLKTQLSSSKGLMTRLFQWRERQREKVRDTERKRAIDKKKERKKERKKELGIFAYRNNLCLPVNGSQIMEDAEPNAARYERRGSSQSNQPHIVTFAQSPSRALTPDSHCPSEKRDFTFQIPSPAQVVFNHLTLSNPKPEQ